MVVATHDGHDLEPATHREIDCAGHVSGDIQHQRRMKSTMLRSGRRRLYRRGSDRERSGEARGSAERRVGRTDSETRSGLFSLVVLSPFGLIYSLTANPAGPDSARQLDSADSTFSDSLIARI